MLPPGLELVLFDAGGTLVQIDYAFVVEVVRQRGGSADVSSLALGEVAARRSVDDAADLARGARGADAARIASYLEIMIRNAGVERHLVDPVVSDLEAAHRERILWRVPVDGARETLRGLREVGVRTAVVSNADGRAEAMLDELQLGEHLELVVDSSNEGVEKPDPEIFRRTLARLAVQPERAAYVGDIYSIDVMGARAAGLAPILIDATGTYGPVNCPVIRRLAELLTLQKESAA